MRRPRLLASISLVVVLILSGSGWFYWQSRSTPAELQQVPTVQEFTNQIHTSSHRRDFLIGSIAVCLSKPGAITLTGASVDSKQFPVVDYTARRDPFLSGRDGLTDWFGPLSSYNVGPRAQTFTIPCGGEDDFYEVILQIQAPQKTAVTNGFSLQYKSGPKTRSLHIPYHLILCANRSDAACMH